MFIVTPIIYYVGIFGFFYCSIFYNSYLYTDFSKEYTESGFTKIKPGMSQSQVLFLVGEPLRKDSSIESATWTYSRSSRWSHYRSRGVIFSNGKVKEAFSYTYVD
jgi:outer membrane protein assembly factor BamE (lipoprotein component of BamABCDE complex)